jgi:hypothetical protein
MLTGLLREETAVPINDRKRKKDAKDNKKREGAGPPNDRIPLPNLPTNIVNERNQIRVLRKQQEFAI